MITIVNAVIEKDYVAPSLQAIHNGPAMMNMHQLQIKLQINLAIFHWVYRLDRQHHFPCDLCLLRAEIQQFLR